MMNPFYRPTHNTPVLSSDEPMLPSAWTFLMVYHLLVYLAYTLVWLWSRGFELFWLGAAAIFLGLFDFLWLLKVSKVLLSNARVFVPGQPQGH